MKTWLLLITAIAATVGFVGCGSNNSTSDDSRCLLDQNGQCVSSTQLDPNSVRTFTGNLKISDVKFYEDALGVCNIANYISYADKCSRWLRGTAYITLETYGTETSYGQVSINQVTPNSLGNQFLGNRYYGFNYGQYTKAAALGERMTTSISSGNNNQGIDISVTNSRRAEANGIRLRVSEGKLSSDYLDADLEFNGKKIGSVRLQLQSYNPYDSYYNNGGYNGYNGYNGNNGNNGNNNNDSYYNYNGSYYNYSGSQTRSW